MSALAVDELRSVLDGDPVERIERFNGFVAWSKQKEIIRALHTHKRVAVQSSHGPGKTTTAAVILEDFMRLGPCRIVTTAPTWFQVENLLWAEIHTRVREALVPWETAPFKTSWRIRDDWMALGLSPKEPERFQGHHGFRTLLIVDEASGVEEDIFEAGQGFLTGKHSYVLYISNPTRLTGAFARACKPDSGFYHVKISTFDTPNFTDEHKHLPAEICAHLPSQEWVDARKDEWGEDSAQYRVRVLGEFADLTGRAYFNATHLDAVKTRAPKFRGRLLGDPVSRGKIRFEDFPQGELSVWRTPEKGHRYCVFGDAAGQVREEDWFAREELTRGQGDDYCVACVLDIDTGEQVAEYRSQVDPDQYGHELARVCYVYHDDSNRPAWLGVEANSMGQATLSELKHLRFRRLWSRQKYENKVAQRSAALGLVTSRDSRERMLSFARAVVREAPGRIHSPQLLEELRSFVYHRSGYGAATSGAHDDCVIAFAGATEMRDQILHRPASSSNRAA